MMRLKRCLFVIVITLAILLFVVACASPAKVSPTESTDIIKTEAVIDLEEKIEALPSVDLLTLEDSNVVAVAESAFEGLQESEKRTVENYAKLFAAIDRIVLLTNVRSVDVAIAALPDLQDLTIEQAEQIEQVFELAEAIGESGRNELAEYDRLVECNKHIVSLKKIRRVNELISSLPSADVIDECDLDKIDEVAYLYDELSEVEKSEVINADAIKEARSAVTTSYWKDSKFVKYYVKGRGLTFKVNLKSNTVDKLYHGEEELTGEQYDYNNGLLTLGEDFLRTLETGMHTFEMTDSRGKSFKFIVGAGYTEKYTAYFDFDVVDYHSPDVYGVPLTIEENGIAGSSGRFTKSTGNADVFGFFKNGNFGFVNYTFRTDTVYLLEFDVKILSATDKNWWMPIYFGGSGDVAYLFADYSLLFPQVNTLYSEGGLEMKDGYAHVKAVFYATQETVNLEFANWGGGVDILLDNMLLTVLPDDNVKNVEAKIDALPDLITSADYDAIMSVKELFDGLYMAERTAVKNASKLEELLSQLAFIEKAATIVEMIELLPNSDNLTEADYAAVWAAKKEYDGISESAKRYVENYEKLTTLLRLIGESYWNEPSFEFYLPIGESFSVKVELLDNGIESISLNGEKLDEQDYSYADGILDFGELFIEKSRDVYTVVLTDKKEKSFTFFVYLGIKEGQAVYYDFDYYAYSNTNGAAIPSTQYEDGIQGVSQRFQHGGAGTLFGFFRGGGFGFAPYEFEGGKTYTLSFDIKIMEGTAEEWWMPVYFSGNKGDVLYVRQDENGVYLQELGLDPLNVRNRQTVVSRSDGSYRISATFTLKDSETYDNLEFPSWGGAVDILLDNVLLIEE